MIFICYLCKHLLDFTETYRIVIAYTEMEIDIIKQTHVFSGYKSLLKVYCHEQCVCQKGLMVKKTIHLH